MPNPNCCLRLVDGDLTQLVWETSPLQNRQRSNWHGTWHVDYPAYNFGPATTTMHLSEAINGGGSRWVTLEFVTHYMFGNEDFLLVFVENHTRSVFLVDLDSLTTNVQVTEILQLPGTQLPTVLASSGGADYLVIYGLDDTQANRVVLVGPKLVRSDNGVALYSGINDGTPWQLGDRITAHMNAADKSVTLTDVHGTTVTNSRTVNVNTGILQIDDAATHFTTVYIDSDDVSRQQSVSVKVLRNLGNDCLNIKSITISDPAFTVTRINGVAASFPFEICPVGFHNEARLEITFRPSTPGYHNATFTINTDAQRPAIDEAGNVWMLPGGESTFQCSGYAYVAAVKIDALTRWLDFGSVVPNHTKTGQITLRNYGEKNCSVKLGRSAAPGVFAWDQNPRPLAMGEQATFDCSFTPPEAGHFSTQIDQISATPALSTLTYVPELRGVGAASTKMNVHPQDRLRLALVDFMHAVAHLDIENIGPSEILNLSVRVDGPWANQFNIFATNRESAPPNPPLSQRTLLAYPRDNRNFDRIDIQLLFNIGRLGIQRWRPHTFVIFNHNASNFPNEVVIPIGY